MFYTQQSAAQRNDIIKLQNDCIAWVEENMARKAQQKRIFIPESVTSAPQPLLGANGQPMYKFIGGPAHGQHAVIKQPEIIVELASGRVASYFFLESEGNYHYKFWRQ
jgi:hypothetical protein